MSFEYTIKFERDSEAQLDGLLRGIAGFDGIEPQFGAYRYRSKANQGKMPDADVRIQEGGVHLCHSPPAGSGASRSWLRVEIRRIRQRPPETRPQRRRRLRPYRPRRRSPARTSPTHLDHRCCPRNRTEAEGEA